ncbi:MAG: dihydrolipoyllysine-residue succinyltransferase [Luteolibacter sp.]|jgi:2-oxoglutarate dehydrogenase E2 component (dihydrolipoamide succinyltransferase)
MSIDIKVPASGESVTSANVARWHKSNGDAVAKGDVLVTLETDKVSNELEADADGVLEILVNEGEEVDIGTVIARIAAGSGAQVSSASAQSDASPAPKETQSPSPAATSTHGGPVEILVPASGESITSANVSSWRKKDGDHVEAGEILVTLETDKVSNEIEAPTAGILRILVPEGEEVAIGAVIAHIAPGASSAAPASAGSDAPQDPAPPQKSKEQKTPPPTPAERPKPVLTAITREPASVGSGDDAPKTAASASDGESRVTRRKMSMLRRKIATHLVNAQQTAAILTTFNEVDMSAVMQLRKDVQDEFVKKYGVKLGFMSFFIKAVTQALKDVPQINARIDGTDIIENHFYDIGVAIGTEKGLVVPILRDVDKKSFAEIETEIIGYANKARDGKITLEDLTGGVFTISNGGTYGSLLSTPILSPPQSGILGMHTIQQRPVAVNGQVVIRPMMYLAMSYDHRLVDGKEAVTFLIRIKDCLENPARLLLEM